jgi:hypothetical protein
MKNELLVRQKHIKKKKKPHGGDAIREFFLEPGIFTNSYIHVVWKTLLNYFSLFPQTRMYIHQLTFITPYRNITESDQVFGLFRFEPKQKIVCFEDTLIQREILQLGASEFGAQLVHIFQNVHNFQNVQIFQNVHTPASYFNILRFVKWG